MQFEAPVYQAFKAPVCQAIEAPVMQFKRHEGPREIQLVVVTFVIIWNTYCWHCVETPRPWTPIFEWYIARLVVTRADTNLKDICYYKIELCAQMNQPF